MGSGARLIIPNERLAAGVLRNDSLGEATVALEVTVWIAPGADEAAYKFTYDPTVPVQTIGGNDCCNGALTPGGIFDQRVIEARQDVLVYSSEPLKEKLTVTGWVTPV